MLQNQTSETIFRMEYQQLRERYNSYFEAYTDGTKCEQKVAATTFHFKDPDNSGAVRLRDGSSVFNVELDGILLAIKKFLALIKSYKKFIIYTDRFSAVESLRGKNLPIKKTKRFYNLLKLSLQRLNNHSMDHFACRHTWKRKSRQACKISLVIEHGSTFTCLLVRPRI